MRPQCKILGKAPGSKNNVSRQNQEKSEATNWCGRSSVLEDELASFVTEEMGGMR